MLPPSAPSCVGAPSPAAPLEQNQTEPPFPARGRPEGAGPSAPSPAPAAAAAAALRSKHAAKPSQKAKHQQPGFEADITNAIDLFALQVLQGHPASLHTFKATWQRCHLSFIHQACPPYIHPPEFLQLCYSAALLCLSQHSQAAKAVAALAAAAAQQEQQQQPPQQQQQPDAALPVGEASSSDAAAIVGVQDGSSMQATTQAALAAVLQHHFAMQAGALYMLHCLYDTQPAIVRANQQQALEAPGPGLAAACGAADAPRPPTAAGPSGTAAAPPAMIAAPAAPQGKPVPIHVPLDVFEGHFASTAAGLRQLGMWDALTCLTSLLSKQAMVVGTAARQPSGAVPDASAGLQMTLQALQLTPGAPAAPLPGAADAASSSSLALSATTPRAPGMHSFQDRLSALMSPGPLRESLFHLRSTLPSIIDFRGLNAAMAGYEAARAAIFQPADGAGQVPSQQQQQRRELPPPIFDTRFAEGLQAVVQMASRRVEEVLSEAPPSRQAGKQARKQAAEAKKAGPSGTSLAAARAAAGLLGESSAAAGTSAAAASMGGTFMTAAAPPGSARAQQQQRKLIEQRLQHAQELREAGLLPDRHDAALLQSGLPGGKLPAGARRVLAAQQMRNYEFAVTADQWLSWGASPSGSGEDAAAASADDTQAAAAGKTTPGPAAAGGMPELSGHHVYAAPAPGAATATATTAQPGPAGAEALLSGGGAPTARRKPVAKRSRLANSSKPSADEPDAGSTAQRDAGAVAAASPLDDMDVDLAAALDAELGTPGNLPQVQPEVQPAAAGRAQPSSGLKRKRFVPTSGRAAAADSSQAAAVMRAAAGAAGLEALPAAPFTAAQGIHAPAAADAPPAAFVVAGIPMAAATVHSGGAADEDDVDALIAESTALQQQVDSMLRVLGQPAAATTSAAAAGAAPQQQGNATSGARPAARGGRGSRGGGRASSRQT